MSRVVWPCIPQEYGKDAQEATNGDSAAGCTRERVEAALAEAAKGNMRALEENLGPARSGQRKRMGSAPWFLLVRAAPLTA